MTTRPEYFTKVDQMMTLMEKGQRKDGMWSTYWNIATGDQGIGMLKYADLHLAAKHSSIHSPLDHVSVGALADSGVSGRLHSKKIRFISNILRAT